MKNRAILESIVILLVMMFLYASFGKYFDFAAFQRAMHNQPFPSWFSSFLIIIIPPMEMITCILLVMKRTRGKGLLAATILMTVFTLYIGAIFLHLFPRVPCSCGGIIRLLGWRGHLLFNLFFLGIAFTGLIIQKKHYST